MIKVEVSKEFTLERFKELKNIKRKSINQEGRLFVGDTFECDEEMYNYLTGNNAKKETVIKLLEVDPEKESKIEEESKKVAKRKPIKKKTTKKGE